MVAHTPVGIWTLGFLWVGLMIDKRKEGPLDRAILTTRLLPLDKPKSTLLQPNNVKQKRLVDKRKIDRRSGFYKLKKIIFKLRGFYKDGDEIPREDVIDAINEVCGVDARTERKYEKLLIRRDYLRPIGRRNQKVTRVNVRTYSRIDSSPQNNLKEYMTNQGFTAYKFGLFAPKPTVQTQIPPLKTPLLKRGESQGNINNMCVPQGRGGAGGKRMLGDVDREIEKKERVLTHTHISKSTRYTKVYPQSTLIDIFTEKPNLKKRDTLGRFDENRAK